MRVEARALGHIRRYAVVVIVWLLGAFAVSSATAAARSGQEQPPDDPCRQPRLQAATIAGIPVVIAVPSRVLDRTPLIVMYHGFGPPNSALALAAALPPIPGAVTVYPTLPLFGVRIPAGGTDELVRRQKADYIGELLFPAIAGGERELAPLIAEITRAYGLSGARPVVLFGFSAGGAAALLSLTDGRLKPRAVAVLNAPLSISQAAESFERQSGQQYRWTAAARAASLRYDIARDAKTIAAAHPAPAILIMQSERDPGLSVSGADVVAEALNAAFAAKVSRPDIRAITLQDAGHYVLDDSDKDHSAVSRLHAQSIIRGWLELHAFGARQPHIPRCTSVVQGRQARARPPSDPA
jgi:pimeloyl-ACP methyl ester carboxylesterase